MADGVRLKANYEAARVAYFAWKKVDKEERYLADLKQRANVKNPRSDCPRSQKHYPIYTEDLRPHYIRSLLRKAGFAEIPSELMVLKKEQIIALRMRRALFKTIKEVTT